ncbi:MAG: glycoside hydrolase family 97 protein [Gemmatimonadota bacterium]
MRMSPWARRVACTLGSAGALLAAAAPAAPQDDLRVTSPDGRNVVALTLRDGQIYYGLRRDERAVILPSRLGFEFRNAPTLGDAMRVASTGTNRVDETWVQPWGEVREVRDHHNELRVSLVEDQAPGRQLVVVFRVFDDGVGFRYELPEQPGLAEFEITDELTEFAMADDARAWWIPAFRSNRYEYLYSSSPVSTLDTVHTPLTMEFRDGLHVVIHEAHLVDYAGLTLVGGREQNRTLHAYLAPWDEGVKVRGRTPFRTPWRTIQVADDAAGLAPSVLGLNLNPANALDDVSWIRPMKYVGIWWGMHIGTMTWSSGATHGATTENTRRYIDFAAANGFGGVLVEGWNVGWDGNWYENGDLFSFTEPYPDYDLPALAAYARERNVGLIGHHETAMGIENYERQLEDAFDLFETLGIHAVKTGYVGDETPEGHAHHGQYMVRHWRSVIESAARHRIALDVHEPIHDTGERRTFPNMMTREGARGQEYNAWGGEGGNPPEHETILFFTRMLAGPFDFTPGVFDLLIESATGPPRGPEQARPRTTLAKQLALYVVLYSPLQMAADLPENYRNEPGFQFIRDVAVDWEDTRVLDGKIGDYVVVARRERDGEEWFVGAITDEEARVLDVPLSFLPQGRSYVAEIYADGPEAHWRDDPLSIVISRRPVDARSRLTVRVAPGGGQAIRIRPAS